jgi:hypothetical protein
MLVELKPRKWVYYFSLLIVPKTKLFLPHYHATWDFRPQISIVGTGVNGWPDSQTTPRNYVVYHSVLLILPNLTITMVCQIQERCCMVE